METYHTTKGVLKVMRPSRLKFKKDDYLVQLFVRQIITKDKTIEDVLHIGS